MILRLGVAAEIGARLTKRFSAGLQLGIASLSGDYEKRYAGVVAETVPYSLLPLELGVFVHSRILDKVWGGLTLGAHRVGLTYEGETTWSMGFGFGVELGYDVISFGAHSIAVMLRANASYGSDMGFGGVGAGVAYRH